ncbi:MAG: hypothetical protein JNN06_11705 [Gemmobacter sp.]|uniref:hypothetical protein n=1 Tax=Gemmobacter sp. TaxID=1898957 RepID=UPI001A55EE1D|nr:hypothetical protein [Gemmobacter sp.]MBL8562933.1 hypothetical protein [Gemmobacter sp.]
MRSGLALALWLLALPAFGQDQFRIEADAAPPRGAQAAEVQATARAEGAQTGMTYAETLSGDLSAGRSREMMPQTRNAEPARLPASGPVSTVFVLLLLVGLLALWLRYGGAGALLSRAPEAQKKPAQAPEAWNISAEDQAGDPRNLIDQIAAMPDRSAALVRLLRHCLLTAATETDTRLARADTERSAFRRLPGGWRQQGALQAILRRAELAHYGGRPVTDSQFAEAIAAGRSILTGKGAAHA